MKINTRKEAIDNFCKGCTYDSQDKGSWREQVENCEIKQCELYTFRPLTAATIKKLRDEKVAQMTPEQLAAFKKKQDRARESFGGSND